MTTPWRASRLPRWRSWASSEVTQVSGKASRMILDSSVWYRLSLTRDPAPIRLDQC